MTEVFYCGGGNRRFAEIAIRCGFSYGAQMPDTVYYAPGFVDLDPDTPPALETYVAAVAAHRPQLATVRDWGPGVTLAEVLAWAEAIAPYVETVIVIPKVIGGISQIPKRIAGRDVRLGYSVPTQHGSTPVPIWEFGSRDVHLLGGSPHKQLYIARYLNVRSVDGNYHQKMAVRHCAFWRPGDARYARDRYFPKLNESEMGHIDHDAPYVAFELSCQNIINAWRTA